MVYPGITACNGDLSIQAISYCAKNPSQKLPPEEAKSIRKQRILLKNQKVGFENDEVFVENVKSYKRGAFFDLPIWTTLMALMMKNLIKMMRNSGTWLSLFNL